MKLSLMTISALIAVSTNSTAQTDAQKPGSGQADKSQNFPSEQPARMARQKSKQAEAENDKEKSQKVHQELRTRQDSIDMFLKNCMTCGMG